MNYYISDYHFNHAKMLEYDERPFANVKEMEDALVENWNATVKPGDTVYILGDFYWKGKDEDWIRVLRRLTGNKVLICGNHDPRIDKYTGKLRKEFDDIKEYKEIKETDGRKVILSHYPILLYKNAAQPWSYMLCGHVHVTAENDLLEKWVAEIRAARLDPNSNIVNLGQVYNVGCMMPWMAYTPRTLDQIIQGCEAYRAARGVPRVDGQAE